jgi:D-alanyl-D-alanine carboxypeptidase
VEEGILGLVTQSANDAATVLAEGLGGSESNFADSMTRKARELGMSNSIFHNASGLPDPNQITSASDMYRLGRALLKHFPQYYSYFSTERFNYRNRSFHNHNHLLSNYPGTDGIKTGFVNSSGFNLVASARRDGRRLIGVVFGGPTHGRRDAHMRAILDDGFAQLEGREPSVTIAGFDAPNTPVLLRRPGANDQFGRARIVKLKGKVVAWSDDRGPGEGDLGGKLGNKAKASWQIQLGEFSKGDQAEQRLSQAMKTAPFPLRHAKVAVTSKVRKGKKSYVAVLRGITKEEASQACSALRGKGMSCATVVASR